MILINEPSSIKEPLRAAIVAAYYQTESVCVETLLSHLDLTESQLTLIHDDAKDMSLRARKEESSKDGVVGLMYQYDLTTEEGVLLMCLAEALLRVPDKETEDLLINDKLTGAQWNKYLGISHSSFVNTATWGLALTGDILKGSDSPNFINRTWKKMLKRTSEPLIRKAVRAAIALMSKEFVLGSTIEKALKRSKEYQQQGYLFSYDMLGEAALTTADAEHYFKKYQDSILAVGKEVDLNLPIEKRPGISVKLSALYPRYEFTHQQQAVAFLTKQLLSLALMAKEVGICLTVDAEEADRLGMSLDIIEAVFTDPQLKDWSGLGLAVQAYQKRAFYVIDWLNNLAMQHSKTIHVRLVKGAYWDSEIKMAQMEGVSGYPVFTRKVSTDISYLACAQKLLAAQKNLYPRFATHNAYSVAAILAMMGNRVSDYHFEFQNLQGMGKSLHNQLLKRNIVCRIYAPVGSYQELLPYLVRRLLENGANSSFVNQLSKSDTSIETLIENPIQKLAKYDDIANSKIPLPCDIFMPRRKNSIGCAISDWDQLQALKNELALFYNHQWHVEPFINDWKPLSDNDLRSVINPANKKDIVGFVNHADVKDVQQAISHAERAFPLWRNSALKTRCELLKKVADLIEEHRAELMMLAMREAGKTLVDVIAEIREAVDFCRYYAVTAHKLMKSEMMPGYTGETNQLLTMGRGIMAAISPWNFPIAIFTGQVAAALVTGNCVIAKPAEQTALCAAKIVQFFYEAGVPRDVLQFVPGSGKVIGDVLTRYPDLQGVLFTGSTATAGIIQSSLAASKGPIAPLIAETGGINAMIADSTALPEQLVADVILSAFGSAGQRCSALRVLFLQDDTADRVITMLTGAMATLNVGNPLLLSTDIGPVIDQTALDQLQQHADIMRKKAHLLAQTPLSTDLDDGYYFAPIAFELPNLDLLTEEVFGPILHVIRYKREDLDTIINQINNLNYGLTFGIHSRIDTMVNYIAQRVNAGNIYVNRNMIGAVVGVQPFGGQNLSGTGPKAGGPHYLLRLCTEKTITIDTTASGGNASLMTLQE